MRINGVLLDAQFGADVRISVLLSCRLVRRAELTTCRGLQQVPDEEVSADEVEALVAEADAYSLASHLLWAMWALLQSKVWYLSRKAALLPMTAYGPLPPLTLPCVFLALPGSVGAYAVFFFSFQSSLTSRFSCFRLFSWFAHRVTLLRRASTTSSMRRKGSEPTVGFLGASCPRHRQQLSSRRQTSSGSQDSRMLPAKSTAERCVPLLEPSCSRSRTVVVSILRCFGFLRFGGCEKETLWNMF